MKTLFINPDLPVFPGRGGIEYLHTTGFSKLAGEAGLVSLLHTQEQASRTQSLERHGVRLFLWKQPVSQPSSAGRLQRQSSFHRLAKFLYKQAISGLARPQDTLIQDHQFRNMADPLLDALREGTWQTGIVVQSSGAHWHRFLPRFPVKVLMMHDVRALLYRRKAISAQAPMKKLYAWLEAIRYRRYEGRHLNAYDLVVAVSQVDAQWIREHYQTQRVLTLPIPVDPEYFSPNGEVPEIPNRLVFPGMMNHPPNVDAARYFARDIFPVIRNEIPEVEFWIVGRDPAPTVQSLDDLPGVHVTGFVPDIRPYLSQASVIVVPLRYGSGMRQKILEAWGMERCVVSTAIGAEGLDYVDGENLIISDSSDDMTQACLETLTSSGLRDRIRFAGRQVILQQHDPSALSRKYYETVRSIATKKRAVDGPMSVYVDLRWMYPGAAGGIETLARSFLDELARLDRYNRYLVELPTEVLDDFRFPLDSNIKLMSTDDMASKVRRFSTRLIRAAKRRLSVDIWRSASVELLRWAHDSRAKVALSIPGYLRPDVESLSNVLVVPDIQHEYFPEFFSPEHLEERKRLYTQSIKKADHICAISEFTRQTLIERLRIPPECITTTPLAAQPQFKPGEPSRTLRRYGIHPDDYLFFPGHTWPHKNHIRAIESLSLLHQEYRLDPLLILTGSPREAHPALLKRIEELRLKEQVRFLGHVPAEHMPSFYQGAAALLFPSLFEGFGMPVLEAMSCDCPVVCSNTSSLPEVAGDAAILVDPTSVEEIAGVLARLLTDERLRSEMTERGRLQSAKFTWRKFTLQVVKALHHVRQARYGMETLP